MKLWMLLTVATLTITTACDKAGQKNANDTMKKETVYELAVRKVKPGQLESFTAARAGFIATLQDQKGALTDREFQSFYALPEQDDSEVFIGMTEWASMAAAGEAAGELMSTATAQAFFGTLDFKAYALMQPTEGPEFNLSSLAAGPGQVLEVAVRKTHEGQEEAFNNYRKQFVDLLSSKPGVLESYEFAVIGSLPGMPVDGMSVGMTVYESQDAFQQLAGPLMQEEITQKYFGTFDIVASQFAVSVK